MAVFNGSANDIENNKNKVTKIDNTATEFSYPTVKAVEDFVFSQTLENSTNDFFVLEDLSSSILPEGIESGFFKILTLAVVNEEPTVYQIGFKDGAINYTPPENSSVPYSLEVGNYIYFDFENGISGKLYIGLIDKVNKYDYEKDLGDVEAALDSIIAMQESLIGGESV